MYLKHFGLDEQPFSIAPNPRYLYFTLQHQEALAHLSYGLGSAGGIVLLTGEVGTGKTTISRKLLEDIPEHIELAWIVNPRLSAQELLATFCDELSIAYDSERSSIKTFTDRINSYLIEAHGQGRNVVLMIDEAQNLSPDVLEQLRLLTNLETNERKLLQIILLGQPELKEMLARTDLRQLAQRITARFHLQSLSREDSREYVRHRLAVAGCNRPVFSNKAVDLIFSISHGTPRLMNLLCDRALLGVYSCNAAIVEPEHVRQASNEVLGEELKPASSRLRGPLMIAVVLIFANAVLLDKVWPWLPNQAESVAIALQADVDGAVEKHAMDSTLSDPTPSDFDQIDVTPAVLQASEFDLLEPAVVEATMPERPQQSVQPIADPRSKPSAPHMPSDSGFESEPVLGIASAEPALLRVEAEAIESTALVSAIPAQAAKSESVMQLGSIGSMGSASTTLAKDVSDVVAELAGLAEEPAETTRIPTNVAAKNVWQEVEARGTKRLAFQTLARIWQRELMDAAVQPCEQLAKENLLCLRSRVNIWVLGEYNRPVLFHIIGVDGEKHFAVIRALQKGRVVVQLGQQHWNVSLHELGQHWQGDMTLVWSKPHSYQHDIQQGDGGAMIPWLAAQMDRLQGKMIPPQVFTTMNSVLVERIKDFQLAEGMPGDGIVGPLTLMRINQSMPERDAQSIPLLNHGVIF